VAQSLPHWRRRLSHRLEGPNRLRRLAFRSYPQSSKVESKLERRRKHWAMVRDFDHGAGGGYRDVDTSGAGGLYPIEAWGLIVL